MNLPTWCPECGPKVDINEDGCCVTCGASATGRGAVTAHLAIIERDEARAEVEQMQNRCAHVHGCLDQALEERDEARAEVEKLSESAKAAWEAECVMREQRGRYHAELKQERQEVERLRSQIEQLRGVLHIVSLDEYESTSSASEKVHAHARQARVVLNETLAGVTPSDAAHVASLENLFLKACNRAQKWETASKDAYRRGAEAMREACQQWCRAWENDGEAIADALADLQVEEP